MENFVLYDELGRGENSVVYKGRRKGTINFVAIHCIEKAKRAKVTNLVRLTHEISHQNIVQFYEWYETSNHLWLVVEFCTGGSLATVIEQDDHLPESCVRRFGVDLVQGLHHIHSLGIIFSDLRPSKILLDGPGVIKFAGFGISRVEGEDLQELFDRFSEAGETWASSTDGAPLIEDSDVPPELRIAGNIRYVAPEILQGASHSIGSDMWALGCVMFEMYTGHPPFLADSFSQLAEKIIHKDLPPPKVKGARMSSKPSPEFQNLLDCLLTKDPTERLGWEGLVTHPFWEGSLQHLTRDLETDTDLRESVRQSIANFSARASVTSDMPQPNSVLGHIRHVNLGDELGEESSTDPSTITRPDSTLSYRPRTAPGTADGQVSFILSSRPHTAAGSEMGEDAHLTLTSPSPQLRPLAAPSHTTDTLADDQNSLSTLIYHQTDTIISPIMDNPKIQKVAPMKFEPKTLHVAPYTVEKLLGMQQKDCNHHLKAVVDALIGKEKGALSQRHIHHLYYTGGLCSSQVLATGLAQHGALTVLARHVKENSQADMRGKALRVLGLIAGNATELDDSIPLGEVTACLTELLRDNFRNTKVKQVALPALGEVLHLLARMEEARGCSLEQWSVPSITYTLVTRCLRESEEPIVNHYAAKIIENVATSNTAHAKKFAINEVAQLLWYVFTHATADALRSTALSALSRVCRQSPPLFSSVMEKVGLNKLLSTMAMPVTRVQQAVVTMFAAHLLTDTHQTRLLQSKEFLLGMLRLSDSPAAVIRAKALLVVLLCVRRSADTLLICCQHKLVMYMERDIRRTQDDYLTRCLNLLTSTLVNMCPSLTKDILMALEAVSGRKHPSTAQARQLKATLPLTTVLHHLVGSQVFRVRIVDETFIKTLGQLLHQVKAIDSGATHIQGAIGAPAREEFLHAVFGVAETLAQHPTLLSEYQAIITSALLPQLTSLVSSASGETRAWSLRLVSEVAGLYLTQETVDPGPRTVQMKKLQQLLASSLLPQCEELLLEQDPLPCYALKLLLPLLEKDPVYMKELERLGLVPVFLQVLVDHQANPLSGTIQHLSRLLACMATCRDTNLLLLYQNGIVDHLTSLFHDVMGVVSHSEENTDLKSAAAVLQSLLETLHSFLKFVSEVVRKALQAKKNVTEGGTREAEQAESLLLTNKPFTSLTSHLTHLLVHEDADMSEGALRCLSLLVQLFGGEHPEAMSADNMECYSTALKTADAKKQKVILRIIKRMISTDKLHSELFRQEGAGLAATIRSLLTAASTHAEVALSTLAKEVLRTGSYAVS